jgi:tetratricopeptide (TPR) repeat protein
VRKIFIIFLISAAMSLAQETNSANSTDPLDDHSLTCEEMRANPELFFETGVDLGSGHHSPTKVDYECEESIEYLPFMRNLIEMAHPKYCGGSIYYATARGTRFNYIGIGMHPLYFKKNGWKLDTYNEINVFRAWAFSNYYVYCQYEKYKTEAKKALPQLISHFQKNFSLSRQEAEIYSNYIMDRFAASIFYNTIPIPYVDYNQQVVINYSISPVANYMENNIVSLDKIKELTKNSSNADIEQALMVAFLTKKESKIIDFLLENFKYSDESYGALLFVALDYPRYIKVLLDKGADINYENLDGETPLFYAIKNNNYELVKLLIENGADVNHTTKSIEDCRGNGGNQTTLIAAVLANSDIEILKLMNGANINSHIMEEWGKNVTALDIVFSNIHNSYNRNNQTQIDKFEKQAEYLKSIGAKSLNTDRYNALANRYYTYNQTKKALEMYVSAIDAGSNDIEHYYKAGEIYQSMGEYKKSKDCFDKAILLNNGGNYLSSEVFYKQAINNYHLDEINEAVENLEKSSVFFNQNADITEKIIEAFAESNIQEPQEYFKIANLYRKIGNKQKADEYLEKFREAYKKQYAK